MGIACHSIRGFFLGSLLTTALVACGGGGGSGGGSPSPPPTPSASTPVISTQPSSQSVAAGSAATFTVVATGNGTLSYQWLFNGAVINGATAATLTVSSQVTTANAGSYDCVITDTLSGTTASATTSAATLSVVTSPTGAPLSGETAVLANSANHVITTSTQANSTYTWSITNGTITAGEGTAQMTYTAGHLGQVQVAVTISNIAGTALGVQNVVVATSLPIVSLFAQQSVLTGTTGIYASSSPATGATFVWTLAPGTTAAVPGANLAAGGNQYTYDAGATVGTYQLTATATDAAGRSATATGSYSVVRNTFVGDVRDVTPRTFHTATLMNDGRVLVVGGDAGVPSYGTGLPAVASQSNIVATVEVFDPITQTWAFVSPLPAPRFEHSATLLNDGRVLIAGGSDASGAAVASVQIYDPVTQTWSAGTSMVSARALHVATLLADGRVLVTGGVNANGVLSAAEVYDPTHDAWSSAGTMSSPRVLQSATLLPDGEVLVAGGASERTDAFGALSSTERYNPTNNTWKPAAPMSAAEIADTAVLLVSGKVLLSAQIYDPVTDSWSSAIPPPNASSTGSPLPTGGGTTAMLLPDGRVLAAGGFFEAGPATLYDPITMWWTSAGFATNAAASVTGFPSGSALVVGGTIDKGLVADPAQQNSAASAALVSLGGSTALGSHAHAGAYAATSLLADGRVLATGGSDTRAAQYTAATTNADLFDPATNTWTPAAPMSTPRSVHTQTTLANGFVLVTGGSDGFSTLRSSAELYNPGTNAWTPAGTMSTARYQHTATLLASGKVLVAGGSNQPDQPSGCSCTTYVASADLYDLSTNTWSATGPMVTARYGQTATALNNGKVLVTGGFGGPTSTLQSLGAVLASVEIYDPVAGTWSAAASMHSARINHTATLLASGKVLVSGGTDGTGTLSTSEIYDPGTDTWTVAASMSTPRQFQVAQSLSSGSVLVVGGLNDSSSVVFGVGTAEAYDPTADAWSPAGSMVTPRQHFIVVGLGDGRVLLDGGTPNAAGAPEFYRQ